MISTNHQLIIGDARDIGKIQDESVDLVITSPPYPMIKMWDEIFACQNPQVKTLLANNEGSKAFEIMHQELDRAWGEVTRVLRQRGIACINIGDATRTINGLFQLFTNHSRILQYFIAKGFVALPCIIWRKQTNAPNKFMGSGMLPPGAYVTLEHEYILILRKGGRRLFKTSPEKQTRQNSAFFWEERNVWFSDIWSDLKGASQRLENDKTRKRSAAFPFELAHRLINMFSVKGDTVLDPFLGTGTTMLAAMCNERNSIGVEIDGSLEGVITQKLHDTVNFSKEVITNRIKRHLEFVKNRITGGKKIKYTNEHYGFPVVTKQEIKLQFNLLDSIQKNSNRDYTVYYKGWAPTGDG